MQKFIIGREVGFGPKVLLASHPTWGVDIGAALSIRQELIDLAAAGAGILVVSEDLNELFEICDRIAVLHGGRLVPARPVADLPPARSGSRWAGSRTRWPMPLRLERRPAASQAWYLLVAAAGGGAVGGVRGRRCSRCSGVDPAAGACR